MLNYKHSKIKEFETKCGEELCRLFRLDENEIDLDKIVERSKSHAQKIERLSDIRSPIYVPETRRDYSFSKYQGTRHYSGSSSSSNSVSFGTKDMLSHNQVYYGHAEYVNADEHHHHHHK